MGLIGRLKKLLNIKTDVDHPTETAQEIKNPDSSQTKTNEKMTMFNYGVGGNEVKVDANEAIQEIQENKTLLVSKLTTDDAITPEIVTGLKTVEDVFSYYKPAISVEHENEDGTIQKEDFRFNHLGDFSPKNLTQNSSFLKNLNVEQEQYNKIVRQLRSNKVLQNLLNDESSKAAFLETLKAVVHELESVK